MNLLLMADGLVGLHITKWLIANFPKDLGLVVVRRANEIQHTALGANISCTVFQSAEQVCALADERDKPFDIGVSAWWPLMIRTPLLTKPRFGFINTHPSFLPHNRGKHYNFWALVEQAPFGVTLHFADEGIDSGDVIAQASIGYGWEDTGETLYVKAREAMIALFQDTYPAIRSLAFVRRKQDTPRGSFHLASELEPASRIDLDRLYTARELLNLLRARTFSGHPACWFTDDEGTFEVRVRISKKPT